MPELLELIETHNAADASADRLFRGERSVRGDTSDPRYARSLAEAARILDDAFSGRRSAMTRLEEAMTTSDFPLLMGDVLDRMLLARYRETAPVYRNFVRVRTVRDFREVKRFAVDGGEGTLDTVAEKAPYPAEPLSEAEDTYRVQKRGRRFHFSWENFINDDLDAFRESPERLAKAARRSEQRFACELYMDANGPHASLYDATLNNLINDELSVAGLQAAMTLLAEQTDEDGEPIMIDAVELVVPPALEITAQNVLNATMIELRESGGTDAQRVMAQNWMRGRVRINVDPYIKLVASNAAGDPWALFANPESSRPALEMGFLRGHEEPALFRKAPNATRVGGTGGADLDADFDTDSLEWKVRHVFGGTRLLQTGGARATVASTGTGGS